MQWVLQMSGDFHPSEETAVPAMDGAPHDEGAYIIALCD